MVGLRHSCSCSLRRCFVALCITCRKCRSLSDDWEDETILQKLLPADRSIVSRSTLSRATYVVPLDNAWEEASLSHV